MNDLAPASTPEPPYYAVIFTSRRTEAGRADGYLEIAERMAKLASSMPGYLGFEAARAGDGLGIGVSYWESPEAIKEWKQHAEHLEAQRRGMAEFYDAFTIRIARVEEQRSWERG